MSSACLAPSLSSTRSGYFTNYGHVAFLTFHPLDVLSIAWTSHALKAADDGENGHTAKSEEKMEKMNRMMSNGVIFAIICNFV